MTLEDCLSKVRHKGMAVTASFSYSKVKYTTQCSALLWKTTAVSPKWSICGTKKHLLQDQLIQKVKYGLILGHISPSTSQHCFCNQNDSWIEELQTSLFSLKWQPWAMFSKHCSSCQWNGGVLICVRLTVKSPNTTYFHWTKGNRHEGNAKFSQSADFIYLFWQHRESTSLFLHPFQEAAVIQVFPSTSRAQPRSAPDQITHRADWLPSAGYLWLNGSLKFHTDFRQFHMSKIPPTPA